MHTNVPFAAHGKEVAAIAITSNYVQATGNCNANAKMNKTHFIPKEGIN